MTTKRVIKLNKVIQCIENGLSVEEIVSNGIGASDFISKTRKCIKNSQYFQYTSLTDGSLYWSEEIAYKIQVANYLFSKWDDFVALYEDKTKHRAKILSLITGFSEKKISVLYGKSNDNLLLCDLDKIDEFDDLILETLATDTDVILKKFCKIKKNGIVCANGFSGYNLLGVSRCKNGNEKNKNHIIINISDRALEVHQNGKFKGVDKTDPHFYAEMFFRGMAISLFNYINDRSWEEGKSFELLLKYWTAYFLDRYDDTYCKSRVEYYDNYFDIVEDMDFPHIMYYRTNGIHNLSPEALDYLKLQVENGEAYCHVLD